MTSVQPTGFHAAFYKGTRPGISGLYNRIVRWWDRGPYSHCELVFSSGISASSSYLDKGVRFKQIEYDPTHWDFIALPPGKELRALNWFRVHEGAKYDLMGNFRFIFDFLPDSHDRWFCDEAAGAALGFPDPWRSSPNGFAAILRSLYEGLQPPPSADLPST